MSVAAQVPTEQAESQPNGETDTIAENEEWGEGEEEESDEEDDDDDEAEEIARRLRDQLWADISKAQADRAAALNPQPPLDSHKPSSKKSEAIIATIRTILAFVAKDSLVQSTLTTTVIPNGPNILDALNHVVATGTIARDVAGSLSQVLVSLARSDALFGSLRNSNASSIQLDKGKRKRDIVDESDSSLTFKRPHIQQYDLRPQILDAVRIITEALGSTDSSQTRTLDPSLISSIQLQLHQVFLFAVTSSARGGPDMNALQEISGLIQVLGVLSGIQIAAPGSLPQTSPMVPLGGAHPWPNQLTDIGTAVYPCTVQGCHKIFSRLYSLRAHQRIHSIHRPYRCSVCPASFARNHDLKRHAKLHDKKAWKCCGCDKVFSRRDAIKRHKNGARSRGGRGEVCVAAQLVEVELHQEEREEAVKEGRRVKMWNGIVANQSQTPGIVYSDDLGVEEGEVLPSIVAQAQVTVMGLHGLLQAHVTNVLGAPPGNTFSAPPVDPAAGQATLASVIARAQSQNLLSKQTDSPLAVQDYGSALPTDVGSMPDQEPPGQPTDEPGHALSIYGLSDEQTRMLEEAIANAASAAQAQAEAEAALEEGEEDDDDDEQPESGGEANVIITEQ